MKRIMLVVSLTGFLCCMLGNAVLAQKGKPTSMPVTTVIQRSAPETLPAYRLQGDAQGSYYSYDFGQDEVVSEIQSIGDWVLEVNNSATRRVLLDFGDPVSGTPATPPFLIGEVPARLISKCASWGGNLKTMTLGATLDCPLSIAFDYGGQSYAVRMNPVNFPETSHSQWTCLGVDAAGKCNQWRLEPGELVDGQKKNVGQLVRLVTVRGQTTNEDRGDYYISFQINIGNP